MNTRRSRPENAGYSADDILAWLEAHCSTVNRAGMARFGIDTAQAFGIGNAVLRPFARTLGRDHDRAAQLWHSGWREARLLALFTDDPARLSLQEARAMADDFNSWDIVDHAADLFVKAGFLDRLAGEFAADEREFVRRAAFAMIASGAVHLKKRDDADFLAFLPLIERHTADPRNFVMKAVNWALRQIGKRSPACHGSALEMAQTLAASKDRTARWIGSNAARELSDPTRIARLGGAKPPATRRRTANRR